MDLQELSQWMKERNLKGHWEHSEWSQTVKPYLWKGEEIMQALNWSGELITTGEAGRRTIQMRNPGLAAGMTNTVHISVQLVKPGEVAAAHRHTAAAIRFIVKGTPNAYTIVEGERFPMFEGDFITTPNWTWHDHFNGSNEPVMWLDGLDVRLVTHFGAMIQENFKKDQQPVERPDNFSSKVFAHARPTWIKNSFQAPPYRYPWEETNASLQALKESAGDPYDGVLLGICQPGRRRPHVADLFLLDPAAAAAAKKPRRTGTPARRFIMRFAAAGMTKVSANEFNWDKSDIFVVPSWQWHSHENTTGEDAILFSISDRPSTEALGLYREEAE